MEKNNLLESQKFKKDKKRKNFDKQILDGGSDFNADELFLDEDLVHNVDINAPF